MDKEAALVVAVRVTENYALRGRGEFHPSIIRISRRNKTPTGLVVCVLCHSLFLWVWMMLVCLALL